MQIFSEEALAKLQDDQEAFEKENVFAEVSISYTIKLEQIVCICLKILMVAISKSDAIEVPDSVTSGLDLPDSWELKSHLTLTRPSWLAGGSPGEDDFFRISIGQFMQGRTEALGSLDGDDALDRVRRKLLIQHNSIWLCSNTVRFSDLYQI